MEEDHGWKKWKPWIRKYQVEFLIGREPIGRKWVFKKLNAQGKFEKYKFQLIAKFYS